MASSTSEGPANPTTPAFSSDADWATVYFSTHTMSETSRRYQFLLWIAVTFIFLCFALLHWTGSRGGFFGAYWSKWALRRRTWRKKHSLAVAKRKNLPHSQPTLLPSNVQILCLSALLVATIALSVVGPDYIAPGTKVWRFHQRSTEIARAVSAGAMKYDPERFQPQYNISKAWWTAGGRTGLLAFALLPLCVLFVLKAPPFAIFAIPFMVQLYNDKLTWLHRWSGRLIWLMSAVHGSCWTVQLFRDRREPTGQRAIVLILKEEQKFIYAIISFGALTLLLLFSIRPFRRAYYEAFWCIHVTLVPLFLITAALHHPAVWFWCWLALGLWFGERAYRFAWWLITNGYFGGMLPQQAPRHLSTSSSRRDVKGESWEMSPSPRLALSNTRSLDSPYFPGHQSFGSPKAEHQQLLSSPPAQSPGRSFHAASPSTTSAFRESLLAGRKYTPPPGYAHAELLPGQTVRIRFVSPVFLSWGPGQHFLINIPSVARFQTHPFTCASICDERGLDAGRVMVFMIRAKNGFTRELWNAIVSMTSQGQKYPDGEKPVRGCEMPDIGVLLRMHIDGPFGSTIRARWGTHSTVLIIAGGAGVSFGLALLEYMSMCMAGRNGRHLGGKPGGWGKKDFITTRVRFVWLVREFSHLQWCATTIRRCIMMVPPECLQIDIFVTNFKPLPSMNCNTDDPTRPLFSRSRHPSDSADTSESVPLREGVSLDDMPHDSVEVHDPARKYVDLTCQRGDTTDIESHDGLGSSALGKYGPKHEDHILDLTNYDGDNDTALPGEDDLNRAVKRQGTLRREKTRRASSASLAAQQRVLNRRSHSGKQDENSTLHSTSSSESPGAEGLQPAGLLSIAESTDGHSNMSHQQKLGDVTPRTTSPPEPAMPSHGRTESNNSNWDARSDVASIRELMPKVGAGSKGEEVRLEVDEQELTDINIVSEHARPGKPKIEVIMDDEVEGSEGCTIVACCGPVSLNVMVRKIIAAKIDPGRVRRGDMRGMIHLVTEEFDC